MIGEQYVRQEIPVSELHTWTKGQVEKVLKLSFEGKSEERGWINIWMDVAHRPILSRVLAFLGENPDVSGGTMGNPKMPPESLYILREMLEDTAVHNFKYYFLVPYSDNELRFRAFLNYLWIVGISQ